MFSNETCIAEFKFMGIENLDDEILIKCMEITSKYKIDVERLVEEWITFAQTNLGGVLQPTITALDAMVRKKFNKNEEKVNVKLKPEDSNKIKVYSNKTSSDLNHILHAYNAGTQKKTVHKPSVKNPQPEELPSFSPASLNPEVYKPSATYSNRDDQGAVIEIFGSEHLLKKDNSERTIKDIQVKLLNNLENWNSSNSRYMFETLENEAIALNNRIERLGNLLIKKYRTPENNDLLIYGKIRCDGNGRLNALSILLESFTFGKGEAKVVNLQNIPRYSIFPGQIIMLQATSQINTMRQKILMAQKIFHDATPDWPADLPQIPENDSLNIIVACGPYTLSDNLAYQPLQDFIKYVLANQPDVLVLIGPFVDVRHSSIADGTIAETYRSHFQNIMQQIIAPLADTHIQIVVIPSILDAHHHNVYPTPPFDQFSNKQVLMAPDPSLININGVIIGVTSADVLFHLAKTELTCPPQNIDRMARFAEHVLSQQCFYPIYPAQQSAPGKQRLCVDQQLLNMHAEINVMPHILILPSNFKQFIKNVNGCIVINPERLSKGFVGGTFANIKVYPGQTQPSIAENVSCQIIKI